jgi:hypothetical protein
MVLNKLAEMLYIEYVMPWFNYSYGFTNAVQDFY